MRGAPCTVFRYHSGVRIIPADAGSTDYVWRNDVLFQDHPRRCGEHWLVNHGYHFRDPRNGIIPADAGSTTLCRSLLW